MVNVGKTPKMLVNGRKGHQNDRKRIQNYDSVTNITAPEFVFELGHACLTPSPVCHLLRFLSQR